MVLLHFAFIFVFPLVMAPTLVPLGLEYLFAALGWIEGLPVALVLSALECALIVLFFHWLVGWQGAWLQHRELRILETVTAKAE